VKLSLFGVVLALLAFAALVLFLHYQEGDNYALGSRTPAPDSPDTPWLPADLKLTKNERAAWLVDHNGWHHLWKAGDRRWHYTDIAHLNEDLKNRSAGEPGGEWILEAPGLRLRYRLLAGTCPETTVVEIGGVPVPRTILWGRLRTRSDRSESVRDYWWELAP